MKILVTGGAGYIGNLLVSKLAENSNNQLTVLDNLRFNQKNQFNKSNIQFIKGDVRDEALMLSLIKKNDIIFPLAALVGAPLCEKYKDEATAVNLSAISFLAKNKSRDQIVIMPVTNSGYGIGDKDSFCDEKSPLNPISHYGKTKVEAEKILMDSGGAVSFRLATVFGPSKRMRIDLLVNNFTYTAYKEKYIKLFEPHFRRNYIHIEDVVRGMCFAIDNYDEIKNDIYNLGLSTANLTKFQLCQEIKKQIDEFKFEISTDGTDVDKRDYFVSNEKIEKKGFKAQVGLNTGIKQLINLYSSRDFVFSNNY